MSVLGKKLHVMKTGGSDEAISLYTTTGECAEPNLKLQVDGTTVYAKLGATTESNATSLRVYRNSDSKTYAVLKEAEVALGTFNMVAGNYTTDRGTYIGYETSAHSSSFGSLNPTSFTYNGTTYEIVYIGTWNANATLVFFAQVMPFKTITLSINGTKYTGTRDEFANMYYTLSSPCLFVSGNTYTVKILSFS